MAVKFELTTPSEIQVCTLCHAMSTEPVKVTSKVVEGVFAGATGHEFVCLSCIRQLNNVAYGSKSYVADDIPF